MSFGSLIDVLSTRSREQGDGTAFLFLSDGEVEAERLTYRELELRARALAAALQDLHLEGERVLLLYPPGLEFIAAFLGCLYAGSIAVPAYPPRKATAPRSRGAQAGAAGAPHPSLHRLQAIARDAAPKAALTTSSIRRRTEGFAAELPGLAGMTWLATDELPDSLASHWREPAVGPGTLAFLQYTSGSTGNPKGVMVSHGNLLHNEAVIARSCGHDAASRFVSWLPMYHDMGLIGSVLQPLYTGADCVLMSPSAFLQRPLRWLQAIDRYRAHTSGAPNFAYELCVQRIGAEERDRLDLSSWRVAFNGAEPVRADTLDRFASYFGPCGFRRETFFPCYGLAEATLLVSGGPKGASPGVGGFLGTALERHQVVDQPLGETGARVLVGCGRTWPEHEVRIVSPEERRACGAGEVGEIWVAGPSVAGGYWNRPEETRETFSARLAEGGGGAFLRTGDLGFLRGGEVYVTGRLKDMIILRGRNHYPQDLELTAERSHPALRPGCGAAFAVEVADEEQLVVVQEVAREQEAAVDPEELARAIRRAISEVHEAQVHAVALIQAGTIPKTSSGKIQRRACRSAFLAGGLALVGLNVHERAEPAAETPDRKDDRQALLALDPASRRQRLEEGLRERIARLLGVAAGNLAADVPVTAQGLDSLNAIELRHELETWLGEAAPWTRLLEGPTPAELAADAASLLEGLEGRPGAAAGESPDRDFPPAEAGAPLSFGQRALWFMHCLAPESGAYNIAGLARIRNELDLGALRRSVARLAGRHEALRTTFGSDGGEPWQRIGREAKPGFSVEDVSGWESGRLRQRLEREAVRPFDLERGPLLRAQVFVSRGEDPILLLAIHHIVADLWSLAVCLRELGELYDEETGGQPAALAPAPRYADWARAERRRLEGPRGADLWSFWSSRLEGRLEPLELPGDRPRPASPSYAGAAGALRLPPPLLADLRRLSRQRGATFYVTLLAGFQALLHRLSGQEEVLVGSPAAGRSASEWAGLVGYCVNPLAMRARLSGDLAWTEHLGRARAGALAALEHQDFPFALLVERLQPVRDPSRSPIFQALFTLQRIPGLRAAEMAGFALGQEGSRLEVGSLVLESMAFAPPVSQLDLSLMAAEAGDELWLSLQVNADLFDPVSAQRVLLQLGSLLAGAVESPERRVGELPLLAEAERHQLSAEWNDVARGGPEGLLLHQGFERQAALEPDREALVWGEGRLSYGELDAWSNRLARRLRSEGVGPEVRVGVQCERSPEMVTAILAVLKAGGAYVPLDPAYPAERLAFMVEAAGVELVLRRARQRSVLPGEGLKVIELEGWEPAAGEAAPAPDVLAGPGNLAYVIFTSGSTGRPKGVAIEHRSAAMLVEWAGELFSPAELARVLASTSINFDLSVFELFAPLCHGGSVVLVDDALQLPAVSSLGVTLVNTVPSVLLELLRAWVLPPSVRTVVLAGEPLRRSLVDQVYARGQVERVWNLYGPSEDTTYSTMARADRDSGEEPAIGVPISGTRACVVDPGGSLVARGVVGELWLGGRGLSRGYLGAPGPTAERFVPDPFSGEAGARLYRTGDLARRRADGRLDLVGRLDQQVKVRGFRIELGEIERALDRVAGVAEAAVVVSRDGTGEPALVAYAAAAAGAVLSPAGLRESLRSWLPEPMVPSRYVLLEALPRTPNGKVDRRALPAPDWRSGEPEDGFVPPGSPGEELLAGLWAELLGLDRVGARDDFFALGGHSLKGVQLASRVRDRFGVELPVRQLFATPTVAGLARWLEGELAGGEPRPASAPVAPVPREGPLPLSSAQRRLWFLDRLEPGSAAYVIPLAVELEGPLQVPALARSLASVLARHEVLRTVFPERQGEPEQVILLESAGPAGSVLPVVDLAGLPAAAREAEARSVARREAGRPFALDVGPLVRFHLLRLAASRHLLLAVMHHIVSDGWSLGVLLSEVSARYEGAEPAPLPVQYADYAVWQQGRLTDEALDRDLSYWRQRLAGVAPLELPTDRPRPSLRSSRGASLRFALPEGVGAGVRRLALERGATPFMVLLTAFQALLSRLSGQADLTVGSPVAGRGRSEVEGLIGCFINTLVLRAGFEEAVTFESALGASRVAVLEAHGHQEVPFERLVEELQPERSLSHSPLYQVLLAYQESPLRSRRLGAASLRPVWVDRGASQFDLTLEVLSEGEGYLAGLEYSTALFDRTTMERLAGQLERLLAGALESPERRLGELPLLSEAERHQVAAEWNDVPRGGPEGLLLHQGFERQAALGPERDALIWLGGRLSYGELDAWANGLARRLRREGVGPEVRVGIQCERSPEMVAAMLAVLKAGGAYVPLDPGYPAGRLAYMAEAAGVALLLSGARQRSALPGEGLKVMTLEGWEPAAGEAGPAPAVLASPGNLAYVIFTSGSTGRPKVVAIEHRSAVVIVEWSGGLFSPAELARVLGSTSINFDMSVFELFGTLSHGGSVVLVEDALQLPAVASLGVTLVDTVPSVLLELLRASELPPSVRTVNLGGEPLRRSLMDQVYARGGVERVWNLYGPSEDTTFSTAARLDPGSVGEPTVGVPVWGTRACVVDREGSLAAPGVVGELWLGGRGLARGYLGAPGPTAERFVPDPFSGEAGTRLYRTGDLVRWRLDGRLDVVGRLDQQVKVRGFRIELGEIERALDRVAGVAEAAVVVSRDGAGEPALVAYAAAAADAAGTVLSPAGLRESLRSWLPEPMVPSRYVLLEALPRTPNGKVDRRALPAPDWRSGEPEDGFVPPGSPGEELLAGLWAELLGLDRVGARDDFFALGGHSLKGVQLASRVRDRFGVELPVRQLFATPTVAGLARWLEGELAGGEPRPAAAPVVPVPREGPLPLSSAQRRLWFLDRLEPGSAAYVIPLAVELEGPLQVPALARSLASVLERHEVLRTVFPEREGEPEQVILPGSPEPAGSVLPVVDLAGLPAAAREAEARSVARREAGRPFDLDRGPLVRFRLLRLAASRHLLLAVMHHIVSDGWSLGVLLSEVSAHYEGAAPAPLPVQYADYAVWQRGRLAGEELAGDVAYWRQRLAGVAPLELPTDRPRPSLRSSRGASLRFALPEGLGAGVRRLALERGATPFMVLLTAFQALLSRLSGQADLTVGSPVAGRGRSEVEGLIGCFINTLVLRAGFEEAVTFESALGASRVAVLEAHGHQEVPFERLVEELQPERSLSHSPLYQVLLAYQESPLRSRRLGAASLRPVWVDRGASQLDLTLEVLSEGEGYLAGLEYSATLFDRTTMERLAGQLERLLAGALASPERRLGELPLLSEAERHQVVAEWNDAAAAPAEGEDELLHRMFERQAEKSPGDRALTFGELGLTYRELNARANQLAHWLLRHGVGPEVRVGIQCERSLEMVVAMLAVHKAGGAYVPMDPAYPQERLALVLEDAGASLVLTRRRLDELAAGLDREPEGNPPAAAEPDNAAYVIYTSGSTGRPKGVMVTHRNGANFFAAMDRRLGVDDRDRGRDRGRGVWLAVTSISFDISVLEILWTLARGFEVVLQPELPAAAALTAEPAPLPSLPSPAGVGELEFSLFYFASEAREDAGADSYRLLLEGARFADRHGFKAVWTPERHFHAFGGLYPNPAVVGAALAAVTERVQIRAGSVVMPLQSPLRVAEEWAVVDRLSKGRVGISFASGWHADDFVLAPQSYGDRKDVMIGGIETVRRLWRGEAVQFPNGVGREVPVRVHPRPLQSELPVWLTAAGNEETFRLAGQLKAGLLTHLLGQSLEELAAKIAVYRAAYRAAGGEGEGHVTLMLHAFLGDDLERVRETVRQPFRGYLRSSFGLMRNLAVSLGRDVDVEALTPEDEELLLDLAFDRYFATSGLFGTPDTCLRQLGRLRGAGVDEVACLIDFGVEVEATLSSLELLHVLKERSRDAAPALPPAADLPVEEQIPRHGVTHLQCTPSMARMLVSEPAGVAALGSLSRLLVGGEALPPALARQLREAVKGEVHNMYGPTETTVWSSSHRLDEVGEAVPIGRPLLNTGLFVLDRGFAPAPPGVPGELFIGGRGVVRGYLGRPDLTAERFVPDPFGGEPGGRLYATGDRARLRPDGVLEFLGRVDHQVKIRGHRIELGEIEATLGGHPAVESAAVAVREERPGEPVLVAYVVPIRALRPLRPALPPEQASAWLAGRQRAVLPNGMEVAVLGDFQAQVLYQEVFQSPVYLRHGIELHDGDCVFDVGANIGFFTLFASRQARGLRIHSFEPIPPTFETLRANAVLYGLDAELHNCGLSSRSEEAELTFYPAMPGLSGRYSEAGRDLQATREIIVRELRARAGDEALRSVEGAELESLLAEQFQSERHRCRLRTLSEVMRERGVERIDLLKVDVERAEVDVLMGIEDGDWDKIGQIVMEVDGRDNLETIVPLLEGRGFQVVVEDLFVPREDAGRSEFYYAHLYARRSHGGAGTGPAVPTPAELSAAALREFLRERLPAYMLPSHLVILDALPLTPNGKVDRRALPSPGLSRPDAEAAYEAPRTEVQRTIAGVWRAVLQVERVGLHDNFFELGGTSLSLVEVRSRLRAALGCEVSLVDLFRSPTVASLALLLGPAAERQAPSFDNARQRARRRRLAVQQRHDPGLEGAEMEEETR